MKLLELSTEKAADVICAMSPMIDEIVNDETIREILGKQVEKKPITNAVAAMELADRIFTSVPVLLGRQRDNIFGVIGLLNEKTVKEIKAQPMSATIAQIREMIQDEELRAFFTSSRKRAQKEQ